MWYGVHRVSHLPQLILCPVLVNMVMVLAIFQISLTLARLWWTQTRCHPKCIDKMLTNQVRPKKPPKHRHRFKYRRKQNLSQSQAIKLANQAKIIHLQNHMIILNPAFASSFMLELAIGLRRIWLIWLKMRCKLRHKVVQDLSLNWNKCVIRRLWHWPFNMTTVGQAWYFIVQPLVMTLLEPWSSQL